MWHGSRRNSSTTERGTTDRWTAAPRTARARRTTSWKGRRRHEGRRAGRPKIPRAGSPLRAPRARKVCSSRIRPDPAGSGQSRFPAAGDSVPPPAGSLDVGSVVGVVGSPVGAAVVGFVFVGWAVGSYVGGSLVALGVGW